MVSSEEKWLQRPLQVGIISGIVTGVVVGCFLILISFWMQENVSPSIILLNHTARNSHINSNDPSMQNIDVNLLISNPSSRSIIIEDVILNVQVNGSWLPKPRDIWLPRTGGGVYYETILRAGDQIISSTRGNDFWMVPSAGDHKVRVTVLYYNGKSTKMLYGYFNLSIDESGNLYEHYQKGEEYNKIKLTDKPEYLFIAEDS